MIALVRCQFCGFVLCRVEYPDGVSVKVTRDKCPDGRCKARVIVEVLTPVDIAV